VNHFLNCLDFGIRVHFKSNDLIARNFNINGEGLVINFNGLSSLDSSCFDGSSHLDRFTMRLKFEVISVNSLFFLDSIFDGLNFIIGVNKKVMSFTQHFVMDCDIVVVNNHSSARFDSCVSNGVSFNDFLSSNYKSEFTFWNTYFVKLSLDGADFAIWVNLESLDFSKNLDSDGDDVVVNDKSGMSMDLLGNNGLGFIKNMSSQL
jgi:hypothetical protein